MAERGSIQWQRGISIVFMIGWTIMFVFWGVLGLPLGPGSEIFFEPPGRG